jgi:hypothetical protein
MPPKTTPHGRDSTNAQVAARVHEVLRIRLDGASFADLKDFAKEAGWNVSDRQLKTYITRADRLLAAEIEKDAGKLLSFHVAQRRQLLARCINSGDLSTALRTLDSEAQLLNLFPAKKVSIASPDPWTPALRNISDDELALLLRVAKQADLRSQRVIEAPEATHEPDPAAGSDPSGAVPPQLPNVHRPLPNPE